MPHKCTVAVIIPTYNRADLLPQAIDSLLVQTRVPDEIIVVDDGSTDDTASKLSAYRLPVIGISQPNQGRSKARNTGLQRTTADLIAFLDSDDTLLPESVEKRVHVLETQEGFDVVYSDVNMIDMQGNVLARFSQAHRVKRPSGKVFAQLGCNNLMPIHAFMFRRRCLQTTGLFDSSIEPLEDYDFWLRMAAKHQFIYLDEPLANYRVHVGMTTITQQGQWLEREAVVHSRIFAMPVFEELSASEKAQIYRAQGVRRAKLGQMSEARTWFRRAVTTDKASLWGYASFALTFFGGFAFRWAVNVRQRLRGDTILFKND